MIVETESVFPSGVRTIFRISYRECKTLELLDADPFAMRPYNFYDLMVSKIDNRGMTSNLFSDRTWQIPYGQRFSLSGN
jgi:hypothetical protein